uniref:UTP--glucose-1-phosphate uridylyltransferase n=1 Tax=Panagrellus redivivus TaxID=6233 RepID=A0A7E4UPT6_PANRE
MSESTETHLEGLQKFFDDLPEGNITDNDKTVFTRLYKQFLTEKATIDWNSWKLPPAERFIDASGLPEIEEGEQKDLLERLAVVRLNGGLGTTMGCRGPKSLIKVKADRSFLEIAVDQIEHVNSKHDTKVPLLLLDSFNTSAETAEALEHLGVAHKLTKVRQFEQSKCPRIYADTLLPVDGHEDEAWYPPGHGNIFETLLYTAVADELLEEGHDVLFVSNIDNTGAIVDARFVKALLENDHEYIMEVTPKTPADIKGGTLIQIEDRIMHLEMPQVPPEGIDEFCSTKTFKIFNTNNIWINLKAVRPRLDEIMREIIANKKKLSDGTPIIQLETSIGGAIRNFPNACALNVGRSRFLPVKRTQDLLVISSDAFELDENVNVKLAEGLESAPHVSLSSEFDALPEFQKRIPEIPSLIDLKNLKVAGNVVFGKSVVLKGNVELIAEEGEELVIEDETVIEGGDY